MRRIADRTRRTELTPAIVTWRAAHGVVAIGFLSAIIYIWWCALTGRRGPALRPAIAALGAEGAVVALNHGDCPLGPLGERFGDEVPLFELVLSPKAAKRAVPALGAVTLLGVGLLAVPRRVGGPDAANRVEATAPVRCR